MIQFGSGALWGNPTTGNLAINPTPQRFGILQDVNVEISQALKELRSANKFPDDVAPSDMKVSGKASIGKLEVDLFNNLFFADTVATGGVATEQDEPATIPTATAFTVTVVNSTTFTTDLGVLYAATSKNLTRVATSPTIGQYTVSAGVYTFASADEGVAVIISYKYSVTTGKTLSVHNQLQGYGPVFEIFLFQPYQGQNGIHLYAARSSKLSMPMKRDGYQIAEFDFEAYANPAGQVMDFFQTSN